MSNIVRVKYWEIIADNLGKAGWSWGCVSAVDSSGRTIWIVHAHRDDGQRFVAHAEEKLTAFVALRALLCVTGTSNVCPSEIALTMYVLRNFV